MSSNLVNSCRPWVGATAFGNPGTPGGTKPGQDSISQFNYLQQLIGQHLDIYRDYRCPYGSTCTTADLPLTADEKHFAEQSSTYINVNWVPTAQWADASGSNSAVNAEIATAAKSIASVAPHKVFLSLWHETNLHVTTDPTDSKCPPATGGNNLAGTPAEFIAAWRNVYNIFQANHANNVIWTMNYSNIVSRNCLVPLLWPGDNYVNWVTWDTYSRGKSWDDTSGKFYDFLKSNNGSMSADNQPADYLSKPWGIGEFGSCQQDPAPAISETAYYNSVKSAVEANSYPLIRMYLIYANTGGGLGPGCLTDYTASTSSSGSKTISYNASKQAAVNSVFAALTKTSSTPSPTPTIHFTAPASGATVSGNSVSVSAAANIGSGASISSVTLKAGNSVLKTCSSASCAVAWDTSALSNGSVALTASTTASDGKTASSTESVTVANSHPVAVAPPSNVISPSQTTTSIGLSWKAGSDSKYAASKLGYQVARNGGTVGMTTPGTTSYIDSGLSPGTYYSYTLTTHDPAGNASVPSAAYTQKTKAPACSQPAAPSGLNAKASSPTAVNLSWKAVPNPSESCVITGYVLSRSSVPLAQPKTTGYTDATVTANTTYSYSVVAVETGNIAGKSASVSVTTPKPTVPDPGPSAPTGVTGAALSPTQVNLTWSASSDRVTGIKDYEVLRDGNQVGTSTTTSFGDSGLSANTSYLYKVVAVSGGDKVASSSSFSVKTLSDRQGGGSGGGSGNGNGSGGNGNGGGHSGRSYVPPILQGTTSVGSGSDTGNVTTSNPTDPGNSTQNQLSPSSQSSSTNKNKSLSTSQVAYVGTGATMLVLLLAGGGWWWFKRRQGYSYQPTYDPDLASHIVVGGGEDSGHDNNRGGGQYGPQPPYGTGGQR